MTACSSTNRHDQHRDNTSKMNAVLLKHDGASFRQRAKISDNQVKQFWPNVDPEPPSYWGLSAMRESVRATAAQ